MVRGSTVRKFTSFKGSIGRGLHGWRVPWCEGAGPELRRPPLPIRFCSARLVTRPFGPGQEPSNPGTVEPSNPRTLEPSSYSSP